MPERNFVVPPQNPAVPRGVGITQL